MVFLSIKDLSVTTSAERLTSEQLNWRYDINLSVLAFRVVNTESGKVHWVCLTRLH